jgi:hypothetical protein
LVEENRIASLTLEQFRDINRRGFPGWVTAVVPGYEGATPYVDPIDICYGAPSFPFGVDPGPACAAFERWCADNLAGCGPAPIGTHPTSTLSLVFR